MDRLKDKLAAASGVVHRQTMAIEADADALIAREGEIAERRQKAFAPHNALLDSHKRDLDRLEDSLQIIENAAPLPDTGGSPAVEPAPPPFPEQ